MKVSSRSLFHYTKEFDNVFKIITNGFRFSHNIDEMPLRGLEGDIFTNLGIARTEWHSDVICFCDIPLSASEDHKAQYGKYVLGLKKAWAQKNGVTPVRYVHKDSPDYTTRYPDWVLALKHEHEFHGRNVVTMLRAAWNIEIEPAPTDAQLAQLPKSVQTLLLELNGLFESLLKPAWNSFHLVKMHKGRWEDRVTKAVGQREFYDEREWRAVGPLGSYLPFTLDDLTRIILTTDEERDLLFADIQKANPGFTPEQERKMYRKITTWAELLDEG